MHKLSVVIPFRDRHEQLEKTSKGLSRFLNHFDIPHVITVVNQLGRGQFNRGKLKNIGFLETENESDYTVFHDVDIFPRTPVYKPANGTAFGYFGIPNYFIPLAGETDWALTVCKPAQRAAGCIFKITNTRFRKVNGFSNIYWGWGFEDMDLWRRVERSGCVIHNQGKRTSKYGSNKFCILDSGTGWSGDCRNDQNVNRKLFTQQCDGKEYATDGLNSCFYKKISLDKYDYCRMINVKI